MKVSRRYLPAGTLIVLLSLFALSACTSPQPVKIGYIAALSGRLSQLGVSSREALQIAVDLRNEQGGIDGRPIVLIFADDQSNPEVGIREIDALVAENVDAIIGPLTSNMRPAIEHLEGQGILVFSPTISTASLSRRDDHFIRLMPATDEQGRIISALMLGDGNPTASVVYDTANAEYTADVRDSFRVEFIEGGGTILGFHPYDSQEDPDFVGLARIIISEAPQALLLVSSAIDAAALAQQLWKLNSSIALYGARWTKTDDILEYGGRAVEGMKMVSGFFDCESEAAAGFDQRFVERTGFSPGFASIYTYEVAEILFSAMEEAPSFALEDLKTKIVNSTHTVYCEEIHIDTYGDTRRRDAYAVIREGTFVARYLE